jgi:hypothetical protein
MNKEQIESLSQYLSNKIQMKFTNEAIMSILITEWFEQNPIEPVVVGMSDVNWEGVSGNADFAVFKMEMYSTDGELVQCINIKTQYRQKSTPQVEVVPNIFGE